MCGPRGRDDLQPAMPLSGEDRHKIGGGKQAGLHFLTLLTRARAEHDRSRVMNGGARGLEVEDEILHSMRLSES